MNAMALEDRDRNFEKAVARQVRANAPETFDCPDAETLAAYHERMLSPEEMAAHKSHIAGCPHCQDILATLEVTEAIPVQVEENEKAYAKGALQAVSAVPAAPALSNTTEVSAPSKRGHVAKMPKRKVYLRSVVPAGAIAAGLFIWISMNTSRNVSRPAQSPAPVEIAENREQRGPQSEVVNPADEGEAAASPGPAKGAMG